MVIRHTGENLKMKSLKEPYPKNLTLPYAPLIASKKEDVTRLVTS